MSFALYVLAFCTWYTESSSPLNRRQKMAAIATKIRRFLQKKIN